MSNLIEFQVASSSITHPSQSRLKKWLQSCLELLGENDLEFTVRIVDEEEIKQLNKDYRNKNKTTNVLSFKSELPDHILTELNTIPIGDIAICAAVVNQEAEDQNKSNDAHWAHILIHGCLHLLGYDHIEDADAEQMELLEVQILEKLGFPNPY